MSATPRAPADTRRAVRGALAGRISDRSLLDALILASEMVVQRVRHGQLAEGQPIHLVVRLGRLLMISVEDTGAPFQKPRGGDTDAEALEQLLGRLSARWGAGGGYRPTLWAELAAERPASFD